MRSTSSRHRRSWVRVYNAWVDANGLDPVEKERGAVARGAFEAGWRYSKSPKKVRAELGLEEEQA